MKILIVDDDSMVRTVCAGMLQLLGHETLTSESGRDALRILADPASGIDLILLDDLMPDMSGRETLAALALQQIRIPVVICSGVSVNLKGYGPQPEYDPVGVLEKPFSMQLLRKVVESPKDPPQAS